MDKYVIDLDKVLDELELNDKFDEPKNSNDDHNHSKDTTTTTNVQYSPIDSLINFNDKIDLNDADFSIQSNLPKLLRTDGLNPGNVFVEHNNNIQTVESTIIQPNLRETAKPFTNDTTETTTIDRSNLKPEKNDILDSKNEEYLSADLTTTCDENNSITLIETFKISTADQLLINQDPVEDTKVDSKEEPSNNSDNAVSQEIKYELENTKYQFQNEKSCDKQIELNSLESKTSDVDLISKEESNKSENATQSNDIINSIIDESSSNNVDIKESNQPVQENASSVPNSEVKSEVISETNENSDPKQESETIQKELIPLDEESIEKMAEEDLDKYLNDLNNDLEILDQNSGQNEFHNEPTENDLSREQMDTLSNNTSNKSLENNSIYSMDSMTVECDDESKTGVQTFGTENENSFTFNELVGNETDTQLQELEELLAATTNNQNQNDNGLNTDSRQTRGGLVQNINYFERQEMPNGLTEEEQMLGKVKPFWIPDEDAQNCLHCDAKFTIIKRRHHCRSCGKVLCSQCCNFKARLPYLEFKEARVCQLCYRILMRIEEIERINGHQLEIPALSESANMNNSIDHSVPDPNNPSEYCSTIPPLEQVSEAINLPPPTVMVPVGVLKRPGSSNLRRSNNSPESSNSERETVKQVMFSDGVRPGGDLVEPPTSSTRLPEHEKPMTRTQLQLKSPLAEKILVPFENLSKRIKLSRVVVVDCNGISLPPILNYNELKQVDPSIPSKPNYNQLIEYLSNPQMPTITFGLTKNLHIIAKIISKNCCNSRQCWSFYSKGLASVGQDEILFVLDCDSLKRSTVVADGQQQCSSTNENIHEFPRDIFRLYTTIYDSASTANLYMDLTHIFFPDGLFNNKENSGFIFTRPTLQCFQNIHVPSPPFLIAILIHKWEIPWAKVFPLRLVLRLGYEYKMYPSPVISYANRKSAYFEIGHTIMNVLADFRNFHYTLSVVKDLSICVEEKKKVSLMIPKLSYEKVCKVLSTSNEHVLAFGGNLSLKADSHFVCIQNEDDDDIHGQYHTKLSSYPGSAQKFTGASFIVFSGALKSSTGLKAKMNIVEDGLLVQIPPTMMEELRSAIKDMKDFKINCCKVTENNSDEWVQLKWVNDELSTNLGVRSQIDGLNLEGIQSARIFSNPDYANERYLIRWIEVFLIQINENSRRSEMINANRLAESVAQAFCVALIDYLDQLYENGLTKISLRISLDVDKVGYETGSGGKPLPPQITQPLDSALIPVIMENISTTGIEDPLIIELLFFVLLK